MASVVKLRWSPEISSGLPRSARRGCDYEAYLPDPLADQVFSLAAGTAADVSDAERAVARLNGSARGLVDSEAVARLLLRAEAVASSRIEGLEIGPRRLLKAQAALVAGDDPADISATEVLNNIDALRWAVETLSRADRITVDALLEVHARLLRGTTLEAYAGKLREEQNWIGGSSYNPCSAAFVPLPPSHVQVLLEDLCAFCDDDRLPPVVQAAIAHAQFETIHPFIDGNGRTGRALIHVVLRRRGLAPTVVPPVSLVLATWAQDYINGLMATRYHGSPDTPAARAGMDGWIALFAAATTRAVADAQRYEERVGQIQDEWRRRLGRVRAGSATALLIEALPGAPVISVRTASELIGRSGQAVNEAVARLQEAGVLRQTNVGRRNRAFEAGELIDAFTALERRLASPEGDTRHSPPSRQVPYRRPDAAGPG